MENIKNTSISICVMSKYVVKVKTSGTAYCGTDFEGDSKYEDYSEEKLKTISGFNLLAEFAENFGRIDIFDFLVKDNTFIFSYFDFNHGSYCDKVYTILKEE